MYIICQLSLKHILYKVTCINHGHGKLFRKNCLGNYFMACPAHLRNKLHLSRLNKIIFINLFKKQSLS